MPSCGSCRVTKFWRRRTGSKPFCRERTSKRSNPYRTAKPERRRTDARKGVAMSEALVLAGTLVVAASGFPGLFFGRNSLLGQRLSTLLAVLGGGLGLAGVGWFWVTGE